MGELGAVDVLARSLRLVAGGFRAYLVAVGPFLVLGALLSVASATLLAPDLAGLQRASSQAPGAALAFLVPYLLETTVLAAASFLVLTVASLQGVQVTRDLQEGRATGLGAAWRRARPRLGAFVATSFAVALMILAVLLVGTVLVFLVLPLLGALAGAVYLLLRWALAPVASALESLGVGASLERGAELTEGERLSLLGLLAVLVAALLAPTALLQAGLGALGLGHLALVRAAASLVVELWVVPWGAATLVLAFQDLAAAEATKHEGEGWVGHPPGSGT